MPKKNMAVYPFLSHSFSKRYNFSGHISIKCLLSQYVAQRRETTLEYKTQLPLIGLNYNCTYLIIYER
jgi:hypothetical protein